MSTLVAQYEHRIMNGNTAYFRFLEGATQEDYGQALEQCINALSKASTTKLVVVNDLKGDWNQTIEEIWIATGKLCETHGIKKWGVVVPSSAIREMTLKRVVKRGGYESNTNYEFFFSRDEAEVISWIKS